MFIEKRQFVTKDGEPVVRIHYPEHLAGQVVEVKVYLHQEFLDQFSGKVGAECPVKVAGNSLHQAWGYKLDEDFTECHYRFRGWSTMLAPMAAQEAERAVKAAVEYLESLAVVPGRSDWGVKI